MCRLVSGRIRHAIEWPGLSAEEKLDGFILPCVAVPESGLVIEASRVVDLRAALAPAGEPRPPSS
jgi:ferredoxin